MVPLEAADLQREPAPVHEQADHDLRIDAAFLGVADLPQLVLVLRLKVERGDVVEDQRDVTAGGSVFEALRGNVVAVLALGDACQAALHRRAVHRVHPNLGQHASGVAHRGRLGQSRGDELEERLVLDDVEPQRRPCHLERLHQLAGAFRVDHR